MRYNLFHIVVDYLAVLPVGLFCRLLPIVDFDFVCYQLMPEPSSLWTCAKAVFIVFLLVIL